ncbi:hypothetical protein E2C01_096554 [Portunus trituberculatus]|uniref:Uncharacterized protein n=1 Tax=Portunus trituberculatus TaxID=210409 RepID=A0A5B7JSV4_PORTR|nr:hypothetical protein [Portunus trituberculatus]
MSPSPRSVCERDASLALRRREGQRRTGNLVRQGRRFAAFDLPQQRRWLRKEEEEKVKCLRCVTVCLPEGIHSALLRVYCCGYL